MYFVDYTWIHTYIINSFFFDLSSTNNVRQVIELLLLLLNYYHIYSNYLLIFLFIPFSHFQLILCVHLSLMCKLFIQTTFFFFLNSDGHTNQQWILQQDNENDILIFFCYLCSIRNKMYGDWINSERNFWNFDCPFGDFF